MCACKILAKIAIFGAYGNSGKFIVDALLETGKYTVTAIRDLTAKNKLLDGVITKRIDYEKPETITEALQGQDALVFTLCGFDLNNEHEQRAKAYRGSG